MWICPECRSIYREADDVCQRDGTPLAEVQAHQARARYPLLGEVIGERYHLIGGLGQGGIGTVYLAQHLHLEQLFAVKFLDLQTLDVDADQARKEGYRDDFLKEARVASLIRHDAVVRVSDFGEHKGKPYLVMEYVPGPSLLHMMASQGRFSEADAISIARRIAQALDAFHERRLVHRDLKPANVILDPRGSGRLTLVDLGLVKDLSGPGGRASTHPMALRGTPGYLAPEQVPAWALASAGVNSGNEKPLVDARVDLYALGVIFYEMLAGVSPYPDGSNTQILIYACTRDPIPLARVEPPVSLRSGLAELIYDTMARDPSRRPATAAEFLERLDELALASALQGSWPVIVTPERRPLALEGLLPPAPRDATPNERRDSPPASDRPAAGRPSVDALLPPISERTMEAAADSFDDLGADDGDGDLDESDIATRVDDVSLSGEAEALTEAARAEQVRSEAATTRVISAGAAAGPSLPSVPPGRGFSASDAEGRQPVSASGLSVKMPTGAPRIRLDHGVRSTAVSEGQPSAGGRGARVALGLAFVALLAAAATWFLTRPPAPAISPGPLADASVVRFHTDQDAGPAPTVMVRATPLAPDAGAEPPADAAGAPAPNPDRPKATPVSPTPTRRAAKPRATLEQLLDQAEAAYRAGRQLEALRLYRALRPRLQAEGHRALLMVVSRIDDLESSVNR